MSRNAVRGMLGMHMYAQKGGPRRVKGQERLVHKVRFRIADMIVPPQAVGSLEAIRGLQVTENRRPEHISLFTPKEEACVSLFTPHYQTNEFNPEMVDRLQKALNELEVRALAEAEDRKSQLNDGNHRAMKNAQALLELEQVRARAEREREARNLETPPPPPAGKGRGSGKGSKGAPRGKGQGRGQTEQAETQEEGGRDHHDDRASLEWTDWPDGHWRRERPEEVVLSFAEMAALLLAHGADPSLVGQHRRTDYWPRTPLCKCRAAPRAALATASATRGPAHDRASAAGRAARTAGYRRSYLRPRRQSGPPPRLCGPRQQPRRRA